MEFHGITNDCHNEMAAADRALPTVRLNEIECCVLSNVLPPSPFHAAAAAAAAADR